MAEVKNNFLGAKMNKDVDARIIPPGEYRNALNLQINKSEGSSVGDLQTSLGNELFIDFRSAEFTNNNNIECIGTYTDEKSNVIIFFLTDYNQPAGSPTYNENAENYIYMCNDQTGAIAKLVEGAFLNFSITNPIIGVNLLEELLFWTDNRNQPRKINIVTAQQEPGYYTTEEQISVAKLSPYIPIEMYKVSTTAPVTIPPTYETTMYDVTSEYYPDGGSAVTRAAVAASATVILKGDGYIPSRFRPKPGQIISGTTIVGLPIVLSFTQSAIAPYDGTMVLSTAQTIPINTVLKINANSYYDSTFIGDPNYLQDRFPRFSYRFKFDDGEYSIFAPFTQVAFIPKQDGYFKRSRFTGTFPLPTTKLVDGDQGTALVSAGYSIKLKDNLTVPLPGQLITCSVPLRVPIETYVVEWNPPYVLMSKAASVGIIPTTATFTFTTIPPDWQEDDQETTYRSTTVEFMQNKVNKILLRVTLPTIASNVRSEYKITEVDILYKEANGLSVSVIDSIPIETISLASPSSSIYEYVYDSKKPFKTLPERELIRVYDKTPVRALAQEIISNRIVYGNYQDKSTYPKYLNYNVKYSQKSIFDASPLVGDNRTSIIEYPNHSLKQNRTYQVGIVLEDLFGRQSGVILSNSTVGQEGAGGAVFKAASLFVPYRTVAENASGGGNALFFPGYSLKMLFNSIIPDDSPNIATGWPGLYQGDSTLPDYNPLGWYSYKIVVKQVEQDYYNVYLPGVLAGYPIEPFQKESSDPGETDPGGYGKTSHIVLLNDNINKVPRDLQEVGPVQLQFRSSVRLYGRVENNILYAEEDLGPVVSSNAQYYPANTFLFANTIATTESLFGVTSTTPTYPFQALYQANSNPLVARLSTPAIYGVQTTKATTAQGYIGSTTTIGADNVISLAVLETQAEESLLDIYWETSTVGLISELNTAILEGSNGPTQIEGFDLTLLTEAIGNNNVCSGRFYFKDVSNTIINNIDIDTLLVTNLLNTPRTADFAYFKIDALAVPPVGIPGGILPYDTFYLKTTTYFYYGFNAAFNESYRFRFTATPTIGVSNDVTKTGGLTNVAPTITDKDPSNHYYTLGQFVHHFNGLNGSNAGGNFEESDQQWDIISAVETGTTNSAMGVFFISNSAFNNPNKRGSVYFTNPTPPGGAFDYTIIVRLTDAGGLTDQCSMRIRPTEV